MMKPSTFLIAAILVAMLAASATAWPHYRPLPPSSSVEKPPTPSRDDVAKCLQAVHGDRAAGESCKYLSYDAKRCCEYVSGLESSCSFVPYYKGDIFKGIVTYVCNSTSPPPAAA